MKQIVRTLQKFLTAAILLPCLSLIPACLAAFLQRNPSASVLVQELPAAGVEAELVAGNVDLGVAYYPTNRAELVFVRAALVRSGGHRGRAAAELGVSRQGLTKLMTRLGIGEH